MSSLLKKFTGESSDIRSRREEELSSRDFLPPQSSLNRALDTNRTNLCSDVEIKGEISFKEYLRLDGKFEGDIISEGTLVVGENGFVKADIEVGNLIVEGKVHGNVVAADKIELRSSAQLFGDIKAARLTISEGVAFVGKSDVNPGRDVEKATKAEEEKDETSKDNAY